MATTAVLTADAPKPAGHYSQAIVSGETIYVSGQLPIDRDGTHNNTASFEVQARRSLMNVLAIVEAAGGSRASILKVTVYIVGVANWPAFNAIYAEMLQDYKPARSVVPVPELHYGYLVEIDAIARVHADK